MPRSEQEEIVEIMMGVWHQMLRGLGHGDLTALAPRLDAEGWRRLRVADERVVFVLKYGYGIPEVTDDAAQG